MTTKIEKESEQVVIVNQSGFRTVMPTIEFAKHRARDLWKGRVKAIEVKTVYKVEEE